MPLAGHKSSILIASGPPATPAAFVEMDGENSVDFGELNTLLDTTDFKDTSGAMTRLKGLEDHEFTIAGDLEPTDAPTIVLQVAARGNAEAHIQWLVDGTVGFQLPIMVENISYNTTVDGKVEVSFALKGNGVLIIVT